MGHPRDLLERIAADVAITWPAASGYRLEFERPLPGVRMFPDIQVVDEHGKIHCVVEIGYTRPEKLTYYRAAGFPDVRWYDRTGQLHSFADLAPELTFKQFDVYGRAVCEDCIDEFGADSCGRHFDTEEDCDCRRPAPLSGDQEERLHDNALESLINTRLTVISNGGRWLGMVYCDDCGESFLLRDADDLWAFADVGDAAEFEAVHLARRGQLPDEVDRFIFSRFGDSPLDRPELTYEQVVEMASAQFGLTITYAEFVEWPRRRAA